MCNVIALVQRGVKPKYLCDEAYYSEMVGRLPYESAGSGNPRVKQTGTTHAQRLHSKIRKIKCFSSPISRGPHLW